MPESAILKLFQVSFGLFSSFMICLGKKFAENLNQPTAP
ncbi:hypothetical protein HMPREF1249_1093 [Jonquetella sp. BV3C21]|nr:hypothetical protein HMPREF1249_1093 [Jonquetella sp. BV3C21]